MNKYEFRRKLEEGEDLIEAGNFIGAVKVFDVLNLELIEQPRRLQNIAKAYERCRRYSDAGALLLQAREIAPRSRSILFHLCIVTIKGGDIQTAYEYYDDFCKIAKYDSQRYVLQYRIAQAEHQPDENLIEILEAMKDEEPDDHWMFELAKLYAKNDKPEEAISVCDEIALWFYSGKYVTMAEELREQLEGLAMESAPEENHRNSWNKERSEAEDADKGEGVYAVPESHVQEDRYETWNNREEQTEVSARWRRGETAEIETPESAADNSDYYDDEPEEAEPRTAGDYYEDEPDDADDEVQESRLYQAEEEAKPLRGTSQYVFGNIRVEKHSGGVTELQDVGEVSPQEEEAPEDQLEIRITEVTELAAEEEAPFETITVTRDPQSETAEKGAPAFVLPEEPEDELPVYEEVPEERSDLDYVLRDTAAVELHPLQESLSEVKWSLPNVELPEQTTRRKRTPKRSALTAPILPKIDWDEEETDDEDETMNAKMAALWANNTSPQEWSRVSVTAKDRVVEQIFEENDDSEPTVEFVTEKEAERRAQAAREAEERKRLEEEARKAKEEAERLRREMEERERLEAEERKRLEEEARAKALQEKEEQERMAAEKAEADLAEEARQQEIIDEEIDEEQAALRENMEAFLGKDDQDEDEFIDLGSEGWGNIRAPKQEKEEEDEFSFDEPLSINEDVHWETLSSLGAKGNEKSSGQKNLERKVAAAKSAAEEENTGFRYPGPEIPAEEVKARSKFDFGEEEEPIAFAAKPISFGEEETPKKKPVRPSVQELRPLEEENIGKDIAPEAEKTLSGKRVVYNGADMEYLRRMKQKEEDSKRFGKLPIEPEIDRQTWHFLVYGENNDLTLECARERINEIMEVNPACPKKIIKLSAMNMSDVSVIRALDNFLGNIVIVEQAGRLSNEQLIDFHKMLERDDRSLLVIFTDVKKYLQDIFTRVPGMESSFTAVFEGKDVDAEDLLQEAKEYLYGKDARLSPEAERVFLMVANELLDGQGGFYRSDMRQFAEKVLEEAKKSGFLGLRNSKLDRDGFLVIQEKHVKKVEKI